MGYRSDVKLITTEAGWERIRKAVYEAVGEDCVLADDVAVLVGGGRYVLAEWEDVKWYEDNNEVSAIMGELKRFSAERIPYQFLRVGEEWDDNEYLFEEDWEDVEHRDMPHLWLKREIEVEY